MWSFQDERYFINEKNAARGDGAGENIEETNKTQLVKLKRETGIGMWN